MTQERYTIYDIETLGNLFTVVFKDFVTKKKKEFVIHESRNNFVPLMKFLRKLDDHEYILVGFNSIQFDAQVIEYMIRNYKTLRHLILNANP